MNTMAKRIFLTLSKIISPASQAGFTLIELIVVVAIIGVVAGGTIAGYYKFNDRQIMIAAAKELVVNMRQAQSKATSGVKPTGCATATPPLRLVGYRVATTVSSSYTVSAICTNGAVQSVHDSRVFYFPSQVRFAPSDSSFQFDFLGQYGGVTSPQFPGGNEVRNIDLRSTGTPPVTYRLTINKSGSIQDLGFQ